MWRFRMLGLKQRYNFTDIIIIIIAIISYVLMMGGEATEDPNEMRSLETSSIYGDIKFSR